MYSISSAETGVQIVQLNLIEELKVFFKISEIDKDYFHLYDINLLTDSFFLES